jgi:predicted RNA-binding Zn-ribbon protein involved in translation (DUF1610 family)
LDLLLLSRLKGVHEMITERLNGFPTKSRQTLNERHCPECGAQMIEVDRHNENGALYVWYECRRDGCDGQWLQKNSQVS